MNDYGLTLVARLAHSEQLDQAIADLQQRHQRRWEEAGLVWTPYRRDQRHATILSVVRSQPRPLSRDWLPPSLSDLLELLNEWVGWSVPQEVAFASIARRRHIVSVHASEVPPALRDLWTAWNTAVDARLNGADPGWSLTNARGENLFRAKYPTYRVFSTIAHLRPADIDLAPLDWPRVTVGVATLSLVSYESRTLERVRAEVVLPRDRGTVLEGLGM